MSLTPDQIEAVSFSMVKRGGYRTEEVDHMVRVVADEMRALHARVQAAEGANEDLQAASTEMAALMRDVHAQLGEKRRLAEAEAAQLRREAEHDAAAILAAATDQAEGVRASADRLLSDAQRQAELLRNDGEQRVRERAQEILRSAQAELQELLRRKHEILHTLTALRSDLSGIEATLDALALSPDALSDNLVDQTLIDLRAVTGPAQVAAEPGVTAPAPNPSHPSQGGSFFSPPEGPPSLN